MTAEPLSTTLSRTLSRLTAEGLTDELLTAAKGRLLHGWGVAFGASRLPASRLAWTTLRGSRGGCLVVGQPWRLTAEAATFVNAVTGHNSLQEDCGPGGLAEGSHPGTYVLPAVLAAAEAAGASGLAALRGVLAGYEAVSRLGAAAPAGISQRRFRPVPLMAPFGAAAGAVTVLGGDLGQVSAAVNVAANTACGFSQSILEGTMEPYLHAGFGARNGLLAAQLAMAGVVTAGRSLEGPFGFFETFGGAQPDAAAISAAHPDAAVSRVGSKRFPACLQNQESMALALDHVPAEIDLADVERITLERPANGTNGTSSPGVSREPPYGNMLHTQMAARFTAAAALMKRPVEDIAYFETAAQDAEVCALAARIGLRESADAAVRIELLLRDGSTRTISGDASDAVHPTFEVLRERFLRRAVPVLGERAFAAAGLIGTLENVADIAELTRALEIRAD
jgi:2-methylcitrate dehydratase PrpD